MNREYNLQIRFDSPYEVEVALAAIEIAVPENDHYRIQDPHMLHAVAGNIWSAFFRDKKGSRPAAMPANFENQQEADNWKEIADYLIQAGQNIRSYVEEVERGD